MKNRFLLFLSLVLFINCSDNKYIKPKNLRFCMRLHAVECSDRAQTLHTALRKLWDRMAGSVPGSGVGSGANLSNSGLGRAGVTFRTF